MTVIGKCYQSVLVVEWLQQKQEGADHEEKHRAGEGSEDAKLAHDMGVMLRSCGQLRQDDSWEDGC